MGEGLKNCEKSIEFQLSLKGIVALAVLDHLTMVFFTLGFLKLQIERSHKIKQALLVSVPANGVND